MKSTYSAYGCPKCGKTTKIKWLPVPDVFEGKRAFKVDELMALKKLIPKEVDKPIDCHYCRAVVKTVKDDREWIDITNKKTRG